MTFVDTSGFYAVLDRDDHNHDAAAAALPDLLARGGLVTQSYAVAETAALVQRRLGLDVLRALFDDLLDPVGIVWVGEDVHRSAVTALLAASRRAVSLVDWVSFEVMRRHRLGRAFAFDPHFTEQGFEVLPRA